MPRTLPTEVRRFIASIPAVILLTAHPPALAQQKATPPSPHSQTQLEDRVKDLEARANVADQKAASAAMEKDYITRIQKQYETYYEEGFQHASVDSLHLGPYPHDLVLPSGENRAPSL